VLHFGQKMNLLHLRVHRDQLLIKVGLDSLVELQVDKSVLARKLQSHDDFATFVDPKFSNFGCECFFEV